MVSGHLTQKTISGDINSSTVLLWPCSIPTWGCKPWMKYSIKLCWSRNSKAKHLLLSSATPVVTYNIRNSVQVKPVWWWLAEYMTSQRFTRGVCDEFPRGSDAGQFSQTLFNTKPFFLKCQKRSMFYKILPHFHSTNIGTYFVQELF